jgi:hypothetical protein
MKQDHGFAELWSSAQQARGAYLNLWVSLIWSWLKTNTRAPTRRPTEGMAGNLKYYVTPPSRRHT